MATVLGKKFTFPLDLKARGFGMTYHAKQVTSCPGCGRSHWYVGRMSAECAFCSTALPLEATDMLGDGLIRRVHVKKLGLGLSFNPKANR